MSNLLGKDTRLLVKSGATFIPVGGETSLSRKRSSEKNDISDKDTGTYGASQYGQQTITLSLSGNVKLPDPGFQALEAASRASPPNIECQLQRGGVVIFDSVMSVGNFSDDYPVKGAATYSCDLDNAGAPTVDNIAATA